MKILSRGTIFDARSAPPQERCCAFTSLERMADGTLLVAFRTGSAKDSADEDIRILRSQDEGQTWETALTRWGEDPAGSGWRRRCVTITEVEPGRVMGLFMWVDHSDPTLTLANPETQGILPTRFFVAESEDHCHSWTSLREVALHPHKGNAVTGEILHLIDGSLALPYEAWKEYYDPARGRHHASLRHSVDGGRSWTGPLVVAHDPSGRVLYWDQRLSIHPLDGRLLALFWTHDRDAQEDQPIHIAWGSPDARQWSEPRSTGIWGQIAAPIILPDGKVLMSYVHRHDPPGLRAVMSSDFGETWNRDEELIFYSKRVGGGEPGGSGKREFADLWADMGVWTFGHPASRLLSNGDILVAYYAGNEEALSMHWVRIAL